MNGVRAVLHYDAGIDIDTSTAFTVRLQYEYTPCTQNERTERTSGYWPSRMTKQKGNGNRGDVEVKNKADPGCIKRVLPLFCGSLIDER